ncbi:hypothetical protein L6452_34915 [Arctium lappa]|uniref:Uncharacterized protein n=1 Tax=Arctium lappa TaxID=4217 RepID=A0ACB8YNR5_ARCLA|nr:hypothetical protein L6452_34915 [Arctium lappa]
MGAQKHGSKGGGGGGYVGGFLHLFDWNAKSRKKLFSSKSESPEQPKQTKRTDGNMPMTRFNTEIAPPVVSTTNNFPSRSCYELSQVPATRRLRICQGKIPSLLQLNPSLLQLDPSSHI